MPSKSSFIKLFFKESIWSILGQIIYLIINLFSTLILARLLSPNYFGKMAIVMFFINISNTLVEGGLGGALIREEKILKKDYSTVFVCNLVISFFLFICFLFFSRTISIMYNDNDIQTILPVCSLILLSNSFQITQNAYFVKQMMFKKLYIYKIIASFFASIISILGAYFGIGIWSLVLFYLLNSILLSLILNIYSKFNPSFLFDKSSFKKLYKFGINTSITTIINSVFNNIYQLIIGKYFSLNQAGLYFQAKRINDLTYNIANTTIQGPIYSFLSNNDIKSSEKEIYLKIYIYVTFIIGIISSSLFIYSDIIVKIVLGDEWVDSVFYFKILASITFFISIEVMHKIMFKIRNITHYILKLEIIKKVIHSITILISIYKVSIEYMMFGYLFTSIISYFLSYYTLKKHTNEVLEQQLRMFLCIFLTLVVTSISMFLVFHLFDNYFLKIICWPFYIIINIIILWLFKVLSPYNDIKKILLMR